MKRGRTSAVAWLVAAWIAASIGVGCRPKTGVAFEQLSYSLPTKTVAVGNAAVAYTEAGNGDRTLVLIHGLGSYLPAWAKNIEALAHSHRVVAIDLPGFGKSSKENFEYSMDFYAQVVDGVIQELDLKRVTLVGHSMGGQIALTYALTYPGQAESLVLTAPAGLETFDDGEAAWLANSVTPEFTCDATTEAIYVRHVANFHRPPKDADFMVEDRIGVIDGPDFEAYCVAVDRSVSAMLDAPVYERLSEIQIPVLVLFGEHDELIPNPFLHGGSTERMAEKAVKQIPRGRLVMLEDSGHMAQFERPAQWNAAVLAFLAEDPGAAPTPGERPRPVRDGIVPLYPDGGPKPRPESEPEPKRDPERDPELERDPEPKREPKRDPEPEPEPEPPKEELP